MDNKDYLVHHGIKGQRWGVRRFQNENGTLTSAGKRRYEANGNAKTRKQYSFNAGEKESDGSEFHDETERLWRQYSDTETPKGEKRSIRSDRTTGRYYKDQSAAVEAALIKNNNQFDKRLSDTYVSNGQWVKADIYSNNKKVGHWMSDGPTYTASEIPDEYYLACVNDQYYDESEKNQILEADYLITNELIDDTERKAVDRAYDYEKEMDTAGASLIGFEKGREGITGTEFCYKQAVIAGNNAIELQKTANALKAAREEQRKDPIKFTKALINTVADKVDDFGDSVSDFTGSVVDAGKKFLKKLFG